jgi:O-antigen/teichoic acid export membrane protein
MAILKNIFYFLTASVLSKALGFVQSYALAKSLGPADFGVWITLMLIVAYSPIICFGTVEALVKMVPYYRGTFNQLGIREIESAVMSSVVVSTGAVLILVPCVPLFLPFIAPGFDSSVIVMVLIAVAVGFFSAYFYNRFVAYENFKVVGILDFVRSVMVLLFIGGMAWLWGFRGAVVGYLLQEIAMCFLTAILNIRSYGRVEIRFRRDLLIDAVRIGFPITLLWWSLTLAMSVDRIVLSKLMGPLFVGYYGLGVSIVGILGLVPAAVGRVLYPKVNNEFGKNAGPDSMRQIVLAPTLALGTLVVNLQGLLLIVMPFLYNQLLPKYQPGLITGQILVLGSFFICLLRNGANYLIATGKERLFLIYILMTFVFNVVFDVSLVKVGLGSAGVAIGTSIAGLLLTSLVWRRVFVGLGFGRRQVWSNMAVLYLPVIILSTVACCVSLLFRSSLETFGWSSVIICMVSLFIVNGLLYFFPFYRMEMHSWKVALSNIRNLLTKRVDSDPTTVSDVNPMKCLNE